MGDLGDYWREHRAYLKSRGIRRGGSRRAATFVKLLKRHRDLGFEAKSEWHWQTKVDGDLLDYWPSKNKWRWRGETKTAPWPDIAAFIKAHEISAALQDATGDKG
jgi:hypothetical protein